MIPRVSPQEVHGMLQTGQRVLLLDVREPEEYAICRLQNALLVPLGELPRRINDLTVDEDGILVVYCHHGIRSLSAVAMLQAAGIQNAVSMNGGIDAWSLEIDPAVPRY